MLNKVILIGNVGADVKTQTFNNGGMCTKFNVATNFKTKVNNEYVEQTTWHPIKVYGNNAKYAAEYLGAGDKVYIEGSIKVDDFDDQQGQPKQFRYVVVNHPSHRLLLIAKSSKHQPETQHTSSYNQHPSGGGGYPNSNNSRPYNKSYNNNNTGYNSNELPDDDFPF